MLDPEDSYALCLARDGVRQPARIIETAERFAIDWQLTYDINGDLFVTADKSGRITAIEGYPTREIVATLQNLRKLGVLQPGPSPGSEPGSNRENE
jgi:hypothetical protein